MITVILTAYKEEKTISKALKFIADPTCSGYTDQIHLIQISPDKQTLSTATNFIKSVHNPNLKFEQIKDPGKSKPNALNMALEKTNSDLVILTDGDVSFAKNALKILVSDFKQNNYDLAGGRPVSTNERSEFMGYISHLMTTAAHDKRIKELNADHKFFPLSGYMLILNKKKFETKTGEKLRIPDDCLVDDAYISYKYFNNGFKLGYIPEAKVKVKFPTTLGDYFKQKKRSTGGYLQLWKYNIVTKDTNSRSIWQELKYFFFPLKFAKKPIEFFYSLIFYPVRLYLWAVMWFERKLRNKAFSQTWVRVESTK
jgi:biofilm PGA synthesis N-glycosyltransferase PgaC